MIVLGNGLLQAFLNDKLARLATYTVRLYINDVEPVPGSVTADFIEANFHGYAGQPLTTWGSVYLFADGIAEVDGPVLTFRPTDSVLPQTVHGWFATDGAGNYVMGERYADDMGFLLDGPDRAFLVQPRFRDQAIA